MDTSEWHKSTKERGKVVRLKARMKRLEKEIFQSVHES